MVLHLADAHLGKRQYNLSEREEDYYKAFTEAMDKAIEERVDAVFISGDLFDSPLPHTSMKPFKVALDKIREVREKGIEVFMIPGDHDFPKRKGLPAIALLAELSGAKLLRGEAGAKGVEYKGFRIHGVEAPSANKKSLEALKRAYKQRNSVALLHLAPCNLFRYGCVDETEVPGGFKYYAMGHLHMPIETHFRGSLMVYPGALEVTSVDEVKYMDKKGPVLVDLSGDEAKVVGRIKVYNRPQVILTYRLPLEYKKALADANKVPQGAVVHLVLIGKAGRSMVSNIMKSFSARALTVRVQVKAVKEEKEEVSVRAVTIEDALKGFYGEDLGSLLAELIKVLQEESDLDVAREVAMKIYESGLWRKALRGPSRRGR